MVLHHELRWINSEQGVLELLKRRLMMWVLWLPQMEDVSNHWLIIIFFFSNFITVIIGTLFPVKNKMKLKFDYSQASGTERLKTVFESEMEMLALLDQTKKLDSNVITPGTEFMALLSSALKYYIHLRMNLDPGWRGIKVNFELLRMALICLP